MDLREIGCGDVNWIELVQDVGFGISGDEPYNQLLQI
jgi:hypothetical protein